MTTFNINPIHNFYFRFYLFFKEIITLALAKRNRGIGAFDGVGSARAYSKKVGDGGGWNTV